MSANSENHDFLDGSIYWSLANVDPRLWRRLKGRRLNHSTFGAGIVQDILFVDGMPLSFSVSFDSPSDIGARDFRCEELKEKLVFGLAYGQADRTSNNGYVSTSEVTAELPSSPTPLPPIDSSVLSGESVEEISVDSIQYTAIQLTDEQRRIVTAPPTEKILVTAGPGTGKTLTLIARLQYLIEHFGLAPGQEILVLSFSRAAVYEIRRRTASVGGDVGFVKAVTFDSFASRLLLDVYPDRSLEGKGYDERILLADYALKEDSAARERLAVYQHVLVDEVQDLVGVRLNLVGFILQIVKCGFTVFGDPAQGIYDFQDEHSDPRLLFTFLQEKFRQNLKCIDLTVNHRAATDAARVALWAGKALNTGTRSGRDIYQDLRDQLSGLKSHHLGTNTLLGCSASPGSTETCAILCRDNGQALSISRLLWNNGVFHRLQRRATDRVVPSWIARAVHGIEKPRVSKREMLNILARIPLPPEMEPQHAWLLLAKIAADTKVRDAIDLAKLNERIRLGIIPDELLEPPRSSLVVSTIHRAKGLEFEQVNILDDFWISRDAGERDYLSEARVLYVGMTRPRYSLFKLTMERVRGLRKSEVSSERWIRTYKHWVNEVEVLGDDLHTADPAGGFPIKSVDPKIEVKMLTPNDAQKYLINRVRVGDPVLFIRIPNSAAGGVPRVYYQVTHNQHHIGVSSDRFAQELYGVLSQKPGRGVHWPHIISGLRIEGVDTVAGTSATSLKYGMGMSGLWLRARVSGLGTIQRG